MIIKIIVESDKNTNGLKMIIFLRNKTTQKKVKWVHSLYWLNDDDYGKCNEMGEMEKEKRKKLEEELNPGLEKEPSQPLWYIASF